jgi:hypothetical protein
MESNDVSARTLLHRNFDASAWSHLGTLIGLAGIRFAGYFLAADTAIIVTGLILPDVYDRSLAVPLVVTVLLALACFASAVLLRRRRFSLDVARRARIDLLFLPALIAAELALAGVRGAPASAILLLGSLLVVLCAFMALVIHGSAFVVRRRLLRDYDPDLIRYLCEHADHTRKTLIQFDIRRGKEVAATGEEQLTRPTQNLRLAEGLRVRLLIRSVVFGLGSIVFLGSLARAAYGPTVTSPALLVAIAVSSGLAALWAGYERHKLKQELARQRAPNVEHALRVDSRPPVLLLRSFADDGLMRGGERFEVWLANELKKFGPLVAIGAPDDELPELGAYRSYVPNHEWQDYARSLMEKAQIILLMPSTSASVGWELSKIHRSGHLWKTALLFPSSWSAEEREKRFRSVWKELENEYQIGPFDLADAVIVHFFDPRYLTTIRCGGYPDQVAIQLLYAGRTAAG